MTAAGPDRRPVRRPVSRAELRAGRPKNQWTAVGAVLEAFAGNRLMMLGADSAEIAHDVLLQAWPRLRDWLEEDQASLILYGQLAEDTARWRQNGKDSSLLYRGVQLAAAQEATRVWAADPGRYPALTTGEADFLRASGRARHPGPVGAQDPGRGAGAAAPRRARRSGSRGQVGQEQRRPAAHRERIGTAGRAEHGARGHRSGHRLAARRGRLADRADRAGALQPAPVARPAGARHPGRPVRRGDRGGLQPGRQDPGGRLPGRHDPAVGHRLASPDQHRVLGRRGARADVHRRRQDPGGSRSRGRRGLGPGEPGQDRHGGAPGRHQRPLRRVQPGRRHPGHRRRRREPPPVGRGHPAGDRRADELGPQAGGSRGVQSRRHDRGRGKQRRHDPAVGRDTQQETGATMVAGSAAVRTLAFTPGREVPGHRRRRRERPAVGRRHPAARPARPWRPEPRWRP